VTQFLASRGYVVIEPEFRSSTGYGSALEVAGWRQWGLTMQDDLQDALQWAIAKGWVDAKRACIMGASYGGYAALMGPVRHPDTYRCAISWVGVTDLPELLKNERYNWGSTDLTKATLELAIGDPKLNAEQLKQTSPVHRAGDIHVPVLAAWGKDDQRVPLDQGRDFRDAAKRAGVELEYVEYADEGHNWLKPETSIDFFTRAEKLLARTIGTR
jgi:dipeptidyl aminopeptidase/acylaminoacyl peptidase